MAAGLKASGGRDVALVVNDGPSDAAAAVFTRNRVQAAPVLWSRQAVADGRLRAVVLNSGGANACTGPAGFADTHATAEHVATALDIGAGEVAVCSTGLIGERLPMDALLAGVTRAAAALDKDGGPDAADAIRTTDTVAKQAVQVHADGWTVGGMAKGAGMLAPSSRHDVVRDHDRRRRQRGPARRRAPRRGAPDVRAGRCRRVPVHERHRDLAGQRRVRHHPLSRRISMWRSRRSARTWPANSSLMPRAPQSRSPSWWAARPSEDDAVEVGRAIARNNLLKCALFGNDPNWGRVLAAVGTTSAAFEPDRLDVSINGVEVCRAGAAGEPRDRVDLTGRAVTIAVDLHAGAASSTIRTTDLSYAYVRKNSAYST